MGLHVLSDAHLFQTYLDFYDSVSDFERIVTTCAEQAPDCLILAGDMFDYKTTNTTYLSHHRGEEFLLTVRDLFRSLEIPIYALCGNHEKEAVLKSMAQTVDTFHYTAGRQWVSLDTRDVLLLDTNYRTSGYPDSIVDRFTEISADAQDRTNPMLVMHETLNVPEGTLPADAVTTAADHFELVLNGHMHTLERGVAGHENVINLPALQPSRRVRGRYWAEQYYWHDNEIAHTTRDSPFGYVTVSGEQATVDAQPITPAMQIVELQFDFTDCDVAKARTVLDDLLDQLNQRNNRDSIIISPTITGTLTFSPLLLEDIPDAYSDLCITKINQHDIERVTPQLEGATTTMSIVAEDDLHEEVLAQVPAIHAQLTDDGVSVDEETITAVIENITGEDVEILTGSQPKVVDALRSFVETNSPELNRDQPANFESHLRELTEEIKQ